MNNKILVIMGSARKGNTYHSVKEIEKNLSIMYDPLSFEYLWLNKLDIKYCISCGLCFQKGENYCPHKDDIKEVVRKIEESEAIIFCSPLYAFQVSAQTKILLDRLAWIIHRPRFFDKNALILITTFATPNLSQTADLLGANAFFWGCNVIGKIKLSGMELKKYKSDNFLNKKQKKQIAKLSNKFYDSIIKQKKQKPTLFALIRFEIQRITMVNSNTYDEEYYRKMGWLDKKTQYYYDVKINPIKRLFSKTITKLVLKIMGIK